MESAITEIQQDANMAMICPYVSFQGSSESYHNELYFLMLYVAEMIKDNPCDYYQVGAKLTEFFTAAAINKSIKVDLRFLSAN